MGPSASSLTCGRCDDRHLVGLLAGSTPAADADVLSVGAVGPAPDPVAAVQQGRLRPLAVDVVQEDQADALAERPVGYDLSVTPEARVSTQGHRSAVVLCLFSLKVIFSCIYLFIHLFL